MTDAVIHPVPRRGYWLPGVALLVCGFLAGALCGGSLVARHVLSKIQKGIDYPESRVEQTVMHMSRSLGLTQEQEEKIRTILNSQDKELISLRQQIWPKVTARLELTEKEIAAILNPEQAEKWKNTVAGDRRQWGPREGPPGGMRPPPQFGGDGRRPGDGRPGEARQGEGRPGEVRPGDLNRRPPRGGNPPRDAAGMPGQRPGRGADTPNLPPPEDAAQPPSEFPPDEPPPPPDAQN
jgi:hypothetical protein